MKTRDEYINLAEEQVARIAEIQTSGVRLDGCWAFPDSDASRTATLVAAGLAQAYASLAVAVSREAA